MDLTQSASTKVRDFAAGLFGWFFVANFIFGVLLYETPAVREAIPDIVFFYLLLGPLWLATIILPPVLFAKGKQALGWGIVTAAVMHCMTWLILMFGRGDVPFNLTLFLLPVPAALLILFDD